MFADLSDKLGTVFKKLRGAARITENNISSAVKEVRMALLEADVNYKVTKDFVNRVSEKAMGEDVLLSVSPAQQFIKIVNDELTETLGGRDYTPGLKLSPHPPTVIMMAGLQGSGKTTTCGKLARYFIKQGRSVMLVACDIYRPAAIEQLEVVAKGAGAQVYTDKVSRDAVKIAKDGLAFAKKAAVDIAIIDTAGRLHIDEDLMKEASAIKAAVMPNEILYVADAMTGQDAVNSASEFDKYLDISGIILSKTDGDARGGAALSVKAVTGKPLLFVGTGEKLDGFALFHPERMAGQILGMGDVVSLVEKAQAAFSEDEAEEMTTKMLKSGVDFNDMLKQFSMIRKMGSLSGLLKMIPGLGSKIGNMQELSGEDKAFKMMEAMIRSMTPIERKRPGVINASRKKRIARGSGRSVQDVNKLLEQLSQMNKMMKKFSKVAGKGGDPSGMLKGLFK